MKHPNDLFRLIKSLSMSEKRYFKVYSSKQTSASMSNCVRLFDAIDRQQTYDEAAIRRQFRNERFVRQLPVQKSYLYDVVLRSLRSYHSNRSAEARIKGLLHDVEVLYARELFSQCTDPIIRAKELALEHEFHELALATLHWQARLAYVFGDVAQLREIADEREELIAVTENLNEYFKLSLDVYELNRTTGWLNDDATRNRLDALAAHPLLEDERRARSFSARTIYFNILDVISAFRGNGLESYRYAREYLRLLESRPDWLRDNLRSYVSAIANAASACLTIGHYDEMERHIEAMNQLVSESIEMRASVRFATHNLRLKRFAVGNEFMNGVKYFDEIRPDLQEIASRIGQSAYCALLLGGANCAFGAGRFTTTLDIVNEILSEARSDVREDIQKSARILNLIVHFELGHDDLLPYLTRSTYRYLLKRDQLGESERILLRMLRRISSTSDARQRMVMLRSTRDALCAIDGTTHRRERLTRLDIVTWLDAKIQERPFQSVANERSQNGAARSGTPISIPPRSGRIAQE